MGAPKALKGVRNLDFPSKCPPPYTDGKFRPKQWSLGCVTRTQCYRHVYFHVYFHVLVNVLRRPSSVDESGCCKTLAASPSTVSIFCLSITTPCSRCHPTAMLTNTRPLKVVRALCGAIEAKEINIDSRMRCGLFRRNLLYSRTPVQNRRSSFTPLSTQRGHHACSTAALHAPWNWSRLH